MLVHNYTDAAGAVTVEAHASGVRIVGGTATVQVPSQGSVPVRFSATAGFVVSAKMLADPEARRPRFGEELPFDLPFPVAAKTGTSRGFADTVAVGVTSEWTVASWGGNFDGKPTDGLLAMTSAAPLVRAGLLLAGRGHALTLPARPPGLAPHRRRTSPRDLRPLGVAHAASVALS